MGIGVVLNDVDKDGFVEVRMANGHIEKYYPEEMETHEEVLARQRANYEEAQRKSKRSWGI